MDRKMKLVNTEWIDEIPIEWEIQNIKSLFTFGKGLPITKDNLKESGISVISYGQIHSKFNLSYKMAEELFRYVDESYRVTNGNSLVKEGDFIFADTSEDEKGCGNFVYINCDREIFAGYHTIILRSLKMTDCKYFAFLFMSDCWRKQIRERVNGVKLFSVTQKNLRMCSLIVPPDIERKRIANFLEAQCDKISELTSTITESIEEYKKLKQAVIMQAITKGVRNNRKMKDSGSIWFGSIPLEWDMKKIKYLFRIKKNIAGEEGYTVLSITQRGIVPKDISKNEGQLAESYANYQIVDPGDFAMNHMDLLTGWIDISTYNGVTSPDYRVFSLINDEINYGKYYLYLMQMCYTNRIFYGLGQGVSGLGRWRLQADKFLNFAVAVPPLNEQMEIAEYLDNKISELDRLIQKKEEYMGEIENYKKSLIYEYVTGKKEVPKEYQT